MKEKVVVLGAGIAGLTASINLLQKGYDVTLIEKNNEVGGLCFGYFVNGHYIDACIHWLMGTDKNSALHKEWRNIGAFDDSTKFISLPVLGTYEYKGTTVHFYRDLDKTEKELLEISPEDKHAIKRFIGSVRDMGTLMGFFLKSHQFAPDEMIRSLPHFPHIALTMKESRERYAKRFKHPAIQFAIKNAHTGYNNMFFFLDFYGLFATGNADVPEGGACYMGQRIKKKFLELGGELQLENPVKELVVKNDVITAAKTKKGTVKGDYFISTIDPQYTMRTLLKGKYHIPLFDRLEAKVDKCAVSSCFNVYIAVDADISYIQVPTVLNIKPTKVGSKKVDFVLVRPYYFDPKHFIKDGKTVVSLFVDQDQKDYHHYKAMKRSSYKRSTKRTAQALIQAFITRYPELEGKVELLSYFGPLELQQRTNTGFGSIQSYSFTDQKMFYAYNGKFKDVKNMYLAGQWNRAIGGTPTALLTALEAVKFPDAPKTILERPKEILTKIVTPLIRKLKD